MHFNKCEGCSKNLQLYMKLVLEFLVTGVKKESRKVKRVINVSSEWSIMLQDSKSWKRLDANVDMWHTLPFAMSLLFCLYIFRISFRINVSRPYLLVQYNCTWLLVLVFFKISVPGRTQLISQPGSCPPRNK